MENANKSFWSQYSYTITFTLCLLLIVSSAFIPAIAIIAMLVFVAGACYFNANKTFGLLFLFLFTELVMHSYLYTAFAFAFALGAITVKAIITKKIKWNKKYIIPLSLIGIILLMSFFVHNVTENFTIAPLRYTIILLAIFAVHILRNEFDIKELFRYFYISLFVTCMFGVIFIFPNPAGIQPYLMDEFEYFRYQGLTGHPNTLYAYPLLAIGVGMYLYFKGKINIWEFLGVSVVCAMLGYITWSKAFLLLMIVYFIIFFCCSFKKGSNYVFIEIFIFLIASAIGYLVLKDQIIKFIDRFFLYFTGENIINTLTTGRYDIWAYYFNMWHESASNVIFGIGANFVDFANFDNPFNYVHCAYLDILVKFGLIGTITICLFFAYLIYDLPKKGLRFINFIPLIVILLNMADEEFISSKIIVLIIAIICLFDAQKPINKEEVSNTQEQIEKEQIVQDKKEKTNKNFKEKQIKQHTTT